MNLRPVLSPTIRRITQSARCSNLPSRTSRLPCASVHRNVIQAQYFSACNPYLNQADATPSPSKTTAKVPTTDLGSKPAGQEDALEKQMFSAIERMVKEKPVVLFMKGTPETPQCGFSRASVQILSLQGVDPEKFAAFNVLEDNDLRQAIKKYSDWPTIPQLYVDGEFVGGCDILMSMHQDQSLAKLLAEKNVVKEV